MMNGTILPILNDGPSCSPPPSPSRSASTYKSSAGPLKVARAATLCALSAAIAANLTSLLCLLLLKDRAGNNVLDSRSWDQNLDMDTPWLRSNSKTHRKTVEDQHPEGVDFAIIGWPKTGTSFLFTILGEHPEVKMPDDEFCDIIPIGGEQSLAAWLKNENEAPRKELNMPQKYGIKCPVMIRLTSSIENLAKMSDATRLVLGVRHPVLWYESYYNYRVKEVYDQNLPRSLIQSPLSTIGLNHWKGVSTAFAEYDLFLKQLAKVPLEIRDIVQMNKSQIQTQDKVLWETDKQPNRYWEKRVSPNPFKVFIYTPEQLSDENASRQEQFRTDLQEFLGLETPIKNFSDTPKINSNKDSYPEYIDICDPKYRRIKNTLLESGRRSSEWILSEFVNSKDVVVSNMEFFTENLKTWSVDPCKSRNSTSNIIQVENKANARSIIKGENKANARSSIQGEKKANARSSIQGEKKANSRSSIQGEKKANSRSSIQGEKKANSRSSIQGEKKAVDLRRKKRKVIFV